MKEVINPQMPNMPPVTPQSSNPMNNNILMGVLAYLGILVIVPILTSKNIPFVKFHIKQGLILAVGELAVYVLGMFAWNIMGSLWWSLSNLLSLGFLAFSITGIVNVLQNQEKPLPYIGQLSSNFDQFLK